VRSVLAPASAVDLDPPGALRSALGPPSSPRLRSALQQTLACGGGTFLGIQPPPPAPAPYLTNFSSLTPSNLLSPFPLLTPPLSLSLRPFVSHRIAAHTFRRLLLLRCQCQTCNKLIVRCPLPSCSSLAPAAARLAQIVARTFFPPSAFQRLACRPARYCGSPINRLLIDPTSASIPATRAQDPLATRFSSVRPLESISHHSAPHVWSARP
jgi:hypothetical protein